MNKFKWGGLLALVVGLFITEYYLLSNKKLYQKTKKATDINQKIISGQNLSLHPISKKGDTINLTWKLLTHIDYVDRVTKQYPQGVMNPIINEELKEMKGRYIKISGYTVPMDDRTYALSQNVMAACFFCGMAGPESVMGIQFKGEVPDMETDQYISLVGTFDYNDTNPEDWIYHIRNAVLTKEE